MDKRAAKVCEMYNKFPFPSIRGNYDSFFRTCVFPALQELGRKGAMKRILDAGCGTGNLTVEIARNFPDAEVVGIDFTDKSLEVASGKINSLGLKNVKLQKSDLLEFSPELGKFDFIACSGVIHHLSDPLKGLVNLNKYLKEECYAFIWVYLILGKRNILEMKEVLEILGVDELPWEKKVRLCSDARVHFEKHGRLNRIINLLKRIEKHGFKGFQRYLLHRFRLSTEKIPVGGFHEDILLADQLLHPLEKFYRFSEVIDEFNQSGFKFIKILEGMSDSLEKSFGNNGLASLAVKNLSEMDIYRLIELKEKPTGVGCLVKKTTNL